MFAIFKKQKHLSDEELRMWCIERLGEVKDSVLATQQAKHLFDYVREGIVWVEGKDRFV
jgi:hypothetical protein